MMSTLFERLILLLHKHEIPIVLLRVKDISEDTLYSGDFDFYLDPTYKKKLFTFIFDFLSKNEINFFIDQKKYGKTKIFIFNDVEKILQLEIWHYLEIKSPFSRITHYIMPEKINQLILKKDATYVLHPLFEALYYLSHLYTKSKNLLAEEINQRLSFYWTYLQEVSPKDAILFEKLLSRDIDLTQIISQVFLKIKKEYIYDSSFKMSFVTFKIKFLKALHKFSFTARKKVKLTPVLGPDGVGKTTFIEELSRQNPTIVYYRFKKLFRKSLLYKLCFQIQSKKNSSLEKNQIDELMGGCVFLSALSHYPFLLFSAIFKTKSIFSDRFFHDYLLKGVRIHQDKLTYISNKPLLIHFIPNTKTIIQLDANSETILKRKQELNHDIICLYRQHIFHLIIDTPFYQYFYLNTKYDVKDLAKSFLYLNETYS